MKRITAFLILAGCGGGVPRGSYDVSEEGGRFAAVGRLRAGEVDDNAGFDDYRRYFKAYPERNVRKIDITDRIVIAFTDPDGFPVSNAPARIFAEGEEVFRSVTTAAGKVMFPPRAVGVASSVRRFEAEVAGCRVRFPRADEVSVEVEASCPGRDEVDVDVAFCLDTTGSMGDEIDRLRSTLRSVVERIGRLSPRPRLRFGMVVYRDHGDEYVTRVTGFTPRLERFQEILDGVRAEAGGDYEEAVSEALHRSVDDLAWSPGAAIRLLFLIGDAPPHVDYGDGYDYSRAMRRALEKGIKIVTLGCSGLNDKGEFIWRQLAQFTLGRFMFISYGGRTRHHVGDYRENNLDDLMVRAVAAEVESLRARRPAPSQGRGRAPDDFREYERPPRE
jgi:hypothetical protein